MEPAVVKDPSHWEIIETLPSYGRGVELPGKRFRSMITGTNLTDVVITGDNGTIDGQGSIWWEWFNSHSLNYSRPNLGEKLLGSLGGMFSKTWKLMRTHSITGPVISRDDPIRSRANHLEQKQRLGLLSSSNGQSRPDQNSNRLQTVEVEKKKQDDALNDVSNILEELKAMAIDMGSEIERQNKSLDHFNDDVEELNVRVQVSSSSLLHTSWNIHPVYCSRVQLMNITVRTPPDSPFTDGIVPGSVLENLAALASSVGGTDYVVVTTVQEVATLPTTTLPVSIAAGESFAAQA